MGQMTVKIGERMYRMPKGKYRELLAVAKEQIPTGVYAVEKGSYAELRKDVCRSAGEVKRLRRKWKMAGFKALTNGI